MGYSAKVGSFNIDTAKTAGQTQSVTGVGFQPKIVLFWWSGSTATGDEVAGGTINLGFGAAVSSSSRWCNTFYSIDAFTTSLTANSSRNDAVIRLYSAYNAVDGDFDFSSMDADGFTLIVDDQFTIAGRISYLALGGTDLTNVYLGSKQRDADAGSCSVTGVGFKPDVVILSSVHNETNPGGGDAQSFTLGLASGSSNLGVVSGYSQYAVGTSNTAGYGYNGEIYAFLSTSSGINQRDSFTSFDDDGFTLNQLEGTTQKYYQFIALKGGQYSVGDLTTRTDGNDIAETVGFQPVALLFASANRALSTQDTPTDNNRLSIGAATSTSNRAVQAISDEDNLADTETAHANYDSAVYANILDDAIVGLMDLKSVESDGFTCVMDDTDPSECWVTYLAIGAAAGEGEPCVNIVNVTEIASTTTPVVVVDWCEP